MYNVDRFKKLLRDFSLKSDIMNTIVGIALIVSLILIFQNPKNQYAILAACIAGGSMNVLTGMKMMKDPKRKMMGMSFIMMGIILAVLGFFLIRSVRAVQG
jgi:hypothetical protein